MFNVVLTCPCRDLEDQISTAYQITSSGQLNVIVFASLNDVLHTIHPLCNLASHMYFFQILQVSMGSR